MGKYQDNYDKCFNNDEPIEGLSLSTLNYSYAGLAKALTQSRGGRPKETREVLEECRVLIDEEYDGQITINLNYNRATEEIRKFVEDAIREKLGA